MASDLLGFGGELPADARVDHGLEVTHRQMDPETAIHATGLEQQDLMAGCRETVGQQAAGRTGTNDDVLVRFDAHRRSA